ncbi:MAG: polyprenyl synthetase family protein [Deltaproteobacteria bacterium]|nr:polyprenyl synthetase family protein [Candidatus Zymogenaceae bacterium]
MSSFDLSAYLKERIGRVDEYLTGIIDSIDDSSGDLRRAMRYSIFAGGKRLRPMFAIAASETVGGSLGQVLPAACALELIHTYSLIHDDLPAMDNDDYRRGVLTNHKVFGEATAILAGDALLTKAFEVLSDITRFAADPTSLLQISSEIARAAGDAGMVGGQMLDMESEHRDIDLDTLTMLHRKKTGALIIVSVRTGAILGGGDEIQVKQLCEYGECVGLAFQISDDILDVVGDQGKLGKRTGMDEARGKRTFISLLGLEESRKRSKDLIERAIDALSSFGERAEALRAIGRYVIERQA